MKVAILTASLLAAFVNESQAQIEVGDFECQTNSDGATVTIVNYYGLTGTIYIPSEIAGYTVTSIGAQAFEASDLTNVVVPSSVTNISFFAFEFNYNLAGIYFQGNAPALGDEVFYYDSHVIAYCFGGTGWSGFQSETGIPAVELQYGQVSFPLFFFDLAADNTSTLIGYMGPTTNLTVPNLDGASVVDIGSSSFNEDLGYSAPTSLTFPDSVLNLEPYAFEGYYSLISVNFGSGVTNVGYDPFADCVSLSSISVKASNPYLSATNNTLFDKNQLMLIARASRSTGSTYTVPATVTDIGDFAFLYCSGLNEIIVPDSVTNIGAWAFYGCSGLTNFIFPPEVTTIQESTFNGCASLTNFVIPDAITNIGGDAFEACTSLGSITIPAGVTTIGGMTFDNCARLTNVVIPLTVTSIGSAAFYQCAGLTSVYIPDSVTNIGEDAFHYCANLTNVVIGRGMESIAPYAFQYCSQLLSILFLTNAPTADATSFGSPNVAYYLPGATGWTAFSSITGIPSVLWNPAVPPGSITVSNQVFGFDISGSVNIPIVIQISTNLADPFWLPVQALTLTNGLYYFSDPQWTNSPSRYYRVSFP